MTQNKKENQMKVLVRTEKTEGLESLLGERVLLMCAGYFYEGILVGVNKTCVKLDDAGIVYSTGAFTEKTYSDLQKLHSKEWYVRLPLIESFGRSKNG
jgi:hypothetical protein